MGDMRTIRVVTNLRDSCSPNAGLEAAFAVRLGDNCRPALLGCLLLMVTLAALAGCAQSRASIQLPPPEVLVANPVQRDVPVQNEWVATLEGYVNAEIRPQVSGYLIKQNYTEGSVVSKGQVLFEIDPRPFQAALDRALGDLARARGELARARADLAQAEAQLGKSKLDVDRDTPLVAQNAVAKEKLDTEVQGKLAAEAAVESAHAAVQATQAAIEANKAAVERADLDLGWTKVTSLVGGIAGIADVQMGNLVGPGSHLTSVSQVDPIKVYFAVSEQEYLRARHASSYGQPMDLVDTAPELILADGTVYGHKGRIIMTDRQIDTATGTIRMVAAFPNPGNILRPGQYGRVRIQTSVKKDALLVPQSAVRELQGSYQVALIGHDCKTNIREVRAGEKSGTMWVINDGLKRDDQVVVEGIDRVTNGTVVTVKQANLQAEAR